MRTGIRILHIAPYVGKASFGVGPIVLNLAVMQQSLGNTVYIWCYDSPLDAQCLEEQYRLHKDTLRSFPIIGPARLGYSPQMEQSIIEEGLTFDVIHHHGIWTGVSRALNRWRKRTARPTVVTAHGSLDPWALRKSHWKKRLAMTLYEGQNLRDVSCMQALSMREATDFRTFNLHSPIAVIPNGVPTEWMSFKHDAQRFRAKHGIPTEARTMLFLARITPKKGLPMLLQAMNAHRDRLNGWTVLIAGVDEYNHQQQVEALSQELSLQPYMRFIGPQYDQDKHDAFAAADLFVLPSHSEGAPVTILEALGAGVPVITTKASPWEELVTNNCGWWTDISTDAIGGALEEALRKSKPVLEAMGRRGKQLVSDKYTWPHIAKRTLTLYDWLIRGGIAPDFVITH